MVGLSLFEWHSEQKLYSIGFKVILSNVSNLKIPLKHYMLEFSLYSLIICVAVTVIFDLDVMLHCQENTKYFHRYCI